MEKAENVRADNSRRDFISKTSIAAGVFLMSGGVGFTRFAEAETLGTSSGIPAVAYGAPSVGATLVAFDLRRRNLRPNDVHVAIRYSGVCHTDWHWIKGEWAGGEYPLVPGHEISGVVVAVGSQVTNYKIGDNVGVGNFVDSCRHCAPCSVGREIYCENGGPTWTYGGHERVNGSLKPNGPRTFGGYSTAIIVDERYVLSIPNNLNLAGAAPLLCAGITTYSPLNQRKVGPGHRVGIVGFGGLGHVGTQIAKAMGAHVTVFTTSQAKVNDAKALGADRVIISTDTGAMKQAASSLDTIVDTIPQSHDLNPYIATVALDGHLWVVGAVAMESMQQGINGALLGSANRSVSSSYCGGLRETQEMLNFCGQHNITARVQVISPQAVNETFEGIVGKNVRYRYVLDMTQART